MTLADLRNRFRDPTPAERQLIDRFGRQPDDAGRTHAFEAFLRTGLPHRRLEQWKWTDFRQALSTLDKPKPGSVKGLKAPDGAIVLKFDGTRWHVPDDLPAGLRISRQPGDQNLGNAEDLPLAALTASLTGIDQAFDVLVVEVGEANQRPVFVDFRPSVMEAAFSRIEFTVSPGAALDVIENYTGGAGLGSALLGFAVGEGGDVTRTIFQSGTADEGMAVTADVRLSKDSAYTQTALAFGAKVSRIETRLSHDGEEAKAILNAAYLAAAGYHIDLTSHVRHGAQSGVTRQLTKGAVANGGRGIFQGKFLVPRTIGQNTDADMQHQALLLEDGAEVFAKPELEIYADDVECAHGNTSGQLDETALFYMRQRGIPLVEARALLTEAFIAEALETAHPDVRDSLIEASRDFLQALR